MLIAENPDTHRARQTSFSFLPKEQIAVCLNKNNELHLRIIRCFIINSFSFITSFTNLLCLGVESPYCFSFAQDFKPEGLDQLGLVSFGLHCLSISASSLKSPRVRPLCIPCGPAAHRVLPCHTCCLLPLSHPTCSVLLLFLFQCPYSHISASWELLQRPGHQGAAALPEPWGETSWFD